MSAPASLSPLYCDRTGVEAILSADGLTLTLDDDQDGTLSATELAYLTVNAFNTARVTVDRYCWPRYDPANLATSWAVYNWACIIAARFVCGRRRNAISDSITELYDEAIADMKRVRSGEDPIPDVGARNVSYPSWSNVYVDHTYDTHKIRVQRPTSDETPTDYPQHVSYADQFTGEP